MKRVAILQEVLPQYRVPFFERLRGALEEMNVELTLLHGRADAEFAVRRDESELQWATEIRNRRLTLGGRRGAVWQHVGGHLRETDLVIVEHANRLLLNYLLLGRRRLSRKPAIAYWGHGANLQSSNPSGSLERFKRETARWADWWFAYTQGSADRVASYGFARDRITVVQNAIDTAMFTNVTAPRNPHQCVYVGALYKHKRIDFLLAASQHVATRLPDFEMHVVGSGPLKGAVEAAAREHAWLHYHGPQFGEQKVATIKGSALMLIPGLVGLAILDAFAAETPIVTTQDAAHSPEVEYLKHGVNGLALPVGVEPQTYADCVTNLLTSQPETIELLRQGCREASQTFTLEHMVSAFSSGIANALEATDA